MLRPIDPRSPFRSQAKSLTPPVYERVGEAFRRRFGGLEENGALGQVGGRLKEGLSRQGQGNRSIIEGMFSQTGCHRSDSGNGCGGLNKSLLAGCLACLRTKVRQCVGWWDMSFAFFHCTPQGLSGNICGYAPSALARWSCVSRLDIVLV